MLDIDEWLKVFASRAEQEFPGRVWFMGLQGSYARGEAKDTSDIDVVLILDKFTPEDLQKYRLMLDSLPEREKICGFVSGRAEIMNWEPSDLFQFCHDTLPLKGTLDEVLACVDAQAVKHAVRAGACNIYHACVHNFLHERSKEILAGLYKSAVFVIQALHFMRTGQYIRRHSELLSVITPIERRILVPCTSGFDESSMRLFTWAGGVIAGEA